MKRFISAALFLALSAPALADAGAPPMPVIPETPGSAFAFPVPVEGSPATVFLRPAGSTDATSIWQVPAIPASAQAIRFGTAYDPSQGAKLTVQHVTVPGIGFTVPNLPKGRYLAWYGNPPGGSAPQPGAPAGQAGGAAHSQSNLAQFVKSAATLRDPNSNAKVNKNNFTVKGTNQQPVQYATADYQSVTIDIDPRLTTSQAVLRGMPGSDVQIDVNIAGPGTVQKAGGSPQSAYPIITVQRTTGSDADLSAADRNRAKTPSTSGPATWTVHISGAGSTTFTARAAGFEPVTIQVIGAQPPPAPATLQPGDVLLYVGNLPFVSQGIVTAETLGLGTPVKYSHAGLYLGKDANGQDWVAEMLAAGWTLNKLADSVGGASQVDAYRYKGISQAQQAQVVSNGRGYGAGGNLLYAYPQIAILAEVAAGQATNDLGITVNGDLAKAVVDTELLGVDAIAGGKKLMICSEMVAWAYHDAGIDIAVTPWQKLRDWSVWDDSKLDRRMDYTTPNMLGRSPSLQFVMQVK